MRTIHNYKELEVWKLSMELVTDIYILTRKFPKEELFHLTSQLRRAAVSIPSNIAEGFGRGTNPQIVNFLGISQGSSYELETQLIVSRNLAYITAEEAEVQKMLNRLQQNYS
jgi:four helix bundle protein